LIGVQYITHMGNDLTVVNAARVSFDKLSTNLSNKDKKLISYLAKHKHMSPFGHCFATFLVSAPVFVARQLVKHKFLRWNEVSRRYVDKDPEFYIPEEWRTRIKVSGKRNIFCYGQSISCIMEGVNEWQIIHTKPVPLRTVVLQTHSTGMTMATASVTVVVSPIRTSIDYLCLIGQSKVIH